MIIAHLRVMNTTHKIKLFIPLLSTLILVSNSIIQYLTNAYMVYS
jgi:hypothetical protein